MRDLGDLCRRGVHGPPRLLHTGLCPWIAGGCFGRLPPTLDQKHSVRSTWRLAGGWQVTRRGQEDGVSSNSGLPL